MLPYVGTLHRFNIYSLIPLTMIIDNDIYLLSYLFDFSHKVTPFFKGSEVLSFRHVCPSVRPESKAIYSLNIRSIFLKFYKEMK